MDRILLDERVRRIALGGGAYCEKPRCAKTLASPIFPLFTVESAALRRLTETTLMTNAGTDEYFGITMGRIAPGLVNMFSEHHVITLFPNAAEAIGFKDPNQLL